MAKSFRLYTLHAQIRDINPPIWRRLQIEGFASMRRLHHTLQAAFGWTDSHLHEFEVDDKTYAMFDLDDVLESMDPDSEEANDYRRWVGNDFNAELFDRRAANAALLRMAWNRWGEK
jgi:hypothetical protein